MTESAVTVDEAVAVLNRIHHADANVLAELVGHRVPCNQQVANDPTVQVGLLRGATTGRAFYEVGLLGVLNGIFGTRPGETSGYIAACYDDGPQGRTLTRFENLSAPHDDRP